jgi:hypothetical protein
LFWKIITEGKITNPLNYKTFSNLLDDQKPSKPKKGLEVFGQILLIGL